jgi:hypothetical protein
MAIRLLTYVQDTSLARWVLESPSLFGYPTILTLHTVGLAMLVGASVAVDLRLLGVARAGALAATTPLFRLMWIGLVINAGTGVLLFIADAVRKAEQPVFWIKLACIAGAIGVLVKVRGLVRNASSQGSPVVPDRARLLALASLALWTGAIAAGRLMAYL